MWISFSLLLSPMMHIQIITLGKLKEAYWKSAEAEYLKRLNAYTKLSFIELKEEPFSDKSDPDQIKKIEAEAVLKRIPQGDVVIALEERGKTFDSPAFARFLEKETMRGAHLTFIIGGPLGLHQTLRERADHIISLSELTFPHQMVRTILLEQLYRAGTILQGKSYHY